MEDHYTILDVTPTASRQEIEAGWRRAVKMWHPDRNRSTEAKFRLQAINTARGVLIDDVTRRRYDREHGFNRPEPQAERMKRPVRTSDHDDGSTGPRSTRTRTDDVRRAQPSASAFAAEPAAANSDWWARFADVARRNEEAVKNEAIRAAAEQDRSSSTTFLDRRPRFTRYVLIPAGVAAIVVAAVLTLILV